MTILIGAAVLIGTSAIAALVWFGPLSYCIARLRLVEGHYWQHSGRGLCRVDAVGTYRVDVTLADGTQWRTDAARFVRNGRRATSTETMRALAVKDGAAP